MSAIKDIAVAVLPVVATQIGEGIREHLRSKRDVPCPHGRPGGRLCVHCSPVGAPTKGAA